MLLAKNRKALFNFQLVEKYMAGIKLHGYEVKAVREGKVNFEGSYVRIEKGEVFVTGMTISKYSKQSQRTEDDDVRRERKLLLNKREIAKISREINEKGKTAVPLALLLKNNLVKLEFAVVKGRSDYGKKHLAKEKQQKKDLERQAREITGKR